MKTLKITWFAILMLIASTVQAQVMETHGNRREGDLYKNYMANLDSVVYVPAQDWNITEVGIEDYYTADNGEVHVVAHVNIGPDAHLAKAAIGNGFAPVDVANDSVANVNLVPGEQTVDFVVPNPEETCHILFVTKNNYYWDYDYEIYSMPILVDYQKWLKEKSWVSLGMGTMTDDVVASIFSAEKLTYSIEIQENKSTPGLYRLKNAYTSAYPYNNSGEYDSSKDYYIEINAENPNQVYITYQPMGMDWGYGMFSIWSYADYYLQQGETPENIEAKGYFGKLENGVITFPDKTLLANMANYENGALFTVNVSGMFNVTLPQQNAAKAKAKQNTPGMLKLKMNPLNKLPKATSKAPAKKFIPVEKRLRENLIPVI